VAHGDVRSRTGQPRGFLQDRDAGGWRVSGRYGEDIGALKRETEQKEDGRYIIFYTFEDEGEED
jgi:hypothetical protein